MFSLYRDIKCPQEKKRKKRKEAFMALKEPNRCPAWISVFCACYCCLTSFWIDLLLLTCGHFCSFFCLPLCSDVFILFFDSFYEALCNIVRKKLYKIYNYHYYHHYYYHVFVQFLKSKDWWFAACLNLFWICARLVLNQQSDAFTKLNNIKKE